MGALIGLVIGLILTNLGRHEYDPSYLKDFFGLPGFIASIPLFPFAFAGWEVNQLHAILYVSGNMLGYAMFGYIIFLLIGERKNKN